jgi:hypothetical protein
MEPVAAIFVGLMVLLCFLLVPEFWLLRLIDRGYSLKELFLFVAYLGVLFAILGRVLHH